MARKQRGRDLTDPQNETLRAELAKVSPKMTQKALAKILGVDQSNVSKFMSVSPLMFSTRTRNGRAWARPKKR